MLEAVLHHIASQNSLFENGTTNAVLFSGSRPESGDAVDCQVADVVHDVVAEVGLCGLRAQDAPIFALAYKESL